MEALPLPTVDMQLMDDYEAEASLEASLESILVIQKQIIQEAGVNKKLAIALESMIPDTLGESLPVASYTEAVSLTNLKPTLEAMSAKVAVLVAAVVAAAAAIAIKIFKWLKDLWDRQKEEIDELKKNLADIEKVNKARRDLEAVYDTTHRNKAQDDLTPLEKTANEVLYQNHNDLLSDLVTKKVVHAFLARAKMSVPNWVSVLEMKVNLLRTVLNSVGTSLTIPQLSDLDSVVTPINTEELVTFARKVTPDIKTDDISAIMTGVKEAVFNLQSSRKTPALKHGSVLALVLTNKINVDDLVYERADTVASRCEKIIDDLVKIESFAKTMKLEDTDQVALVRSTMAHIRNESDAVRNYSTLLTTALGEFYKLARLVRTDEGRLFTAMVNVGLNSSETLIRERAFQAKDDLKRDLK